MNPVKRCMIPIIAILMIVLVFSPLTVADVTNVIDDPEDDVIISSADFMGEPEDQLETTDEKPNVDITKITYLYSEQSNEITLTLKVKGSIDDRNDFDYEDPNATNFTGSMIQYFLLLETSNNTYEIQYMDQNCSVNGESTDFTKSGSSFSVTFDKIDSQETYSALYGYTIEFDILSLNDMKFYMDIAPDEALFIAYASGPSTGSVGEEITFTGEYEDLLGISSGPYTYKWDFDDGSAKGSGSTVSHTFQYPGPYSVEVTIEDSMGNKASATTDITISQGSNNNGNNGNNSNNGGNGGSQSSDEGSSLMLFIAVVAIIVVIGIIALVVVIRR